MVARSICASKHHKGPRWLLALNFHTHPKNRTGLQSWCRTCMRISHRAAHTSARIKANANESSRMAKERQRRERGIQPRPLVNPRFDHVRLSEYIGQFLAGRTLNGVQMTDADSRWVHHLRCGDLKEPPSLKIVDRISINYDLPLWEIIEAAGRYKKDRRTMSK